MDLQLGNLAFSLITTVGGTAFVLAVLLLVAFRFLKRYWKQWGVSKSNQGLIQRSAWFIWLLIVLIVAISVFAGSGPRITVDDTTRTAPNYNRGGEVVKDLNPNKKTDSERVQENRELFRENLQDDK